MWMSSPAGLTTFDGYTFRQVDIVNDQLGHAALTNIAEDRTGRIWLVKSENDQVTVDVFDPVAQSVLPLHDILGSETPIRLRNDGSRLHLYNLEQDIWIGNGSDVYRYDGCWQRLYRGAEGGPPLEWLPARTGLWQIGDSVIRHLDDRGLPCDSIYLPKHHIRNIWIEKDFRLWLGIASTESPAPDRYLTLTTEGPKVVVHTSDAHSSPGAPNPFTLAVFRKKVAYWCYQSHSGEIPFNGLKSSPLSFHLARSPPGMPAGGPTYLDREGGLWAVTDNGIIRLVFRTKLPFQRHLSARQPSLSTRGIGFFRDHLVVNSYVGIFQVDFADGSADPFDNLSFRGGTAFLSDGSEYYIAGHHQPLLRRKADGSLEYYPFDLATEPVNIFCLLRTSDDQLLAGTDAGLFGLDEHGKKLVRKGTRKDMVATLYQDGSQLWAGTSEGLLELDPQGAVLQVAYVPPAHSKFDYISHIHRDSEGIFWMSTHGGGLIRWNPATCEERLFTTADGLSSNNLHAVYPDRYGHLWLPSDFGLVRFHKTNATVRNYFVSDGLPANEFNLLSHFKAPDGTLYLGGINGIVSFEPDDFPRETLDSFELHLTAATTYDLQTGEYHTQPLTIYSGQPLSLLPSYAFLDINLSVLQHDLSHRYRYAWRIAGKQEKWVEQTAPNVRLSNLPYGRHHLQVRAVRLSDGRHSNTLSVSLRVVRPFYLDWPFLILCVLTLSALVRLYTYRRTQELAAANSLLEQEVGKRTLIIETDRALISTQAEELRSLNVMKSRFFANVAHEFRTPLTLIFGSLDRLHKDLDPNGKTTDNLRTIRKSSLRLQNLVGELSDLARSEAGRLTLEETPVVFCDILRHQVAEFLPDAEHRSIRLHVDYQVPADRVILIDIRKWEKIIHNLLGNALKYTPHGGSITLGVHDEAERMVLLVEDTGKGIPEHELPFIFDRYFQGGGPNENRLGGTGIGLALCREYADLFGGVFDVVSTPGKGSRFRLTFPYKTTPLPAGACIPTQASPRIQLPEPIRHEAGNLYTVLVVEDDVDLLHFIRDCLGRTYDLLFADNGLSALRTLNTAPVDLILSDLMMPEMDGFQLLEKVKEICPDLPFVLLTASADMQDRLQALRIGVDDYLTKPFAAEELLIRLHKLVRRHAVRKHLVAASVPTGSTEAVPSPVDMASFDQKWLQKLENFIRNNLQDPNYSVRLMAMQMNTTTRGLQYKTLAFTGLTPRQYLLEARLSVAKSLLETHQFETVREVCFAVGLKTPRHFTKLITKRFGKLPSAF